MVLVMVKYERYMSKAKEISNGWIVMKGYSGELGLRRRGYAGRKIREMRGRMFLEKTAGFETLDGKSGCHSHFHPILRGGSNVTVVATTISHVIGTRSAKKETRREPSELIKTSTGPLTSS